MHFPCLKPFPLTEKSLTSWAPICLAQKNPPAGRRTPEKTVTPLYYRFQGGNHCQRSMPIITLPAVTAIKNSCQKGERDYI